MKTFRVQTMAEDISSVITDLRNEAVERCRKRILEATQGIGKKPRKPGSDFGLMSNVKKQYGL